MSRRRNRCALARDMPAARAACVTLPVASKAARKSRCLSGVQRARSGGVGAAGAGGSGVGCWSIHEDRPEEILFWKGDLGWGTDRPDLGGNTGFVSIPCLRLRGWKQRAKRDKCGQLCQKRRGVAWLQGLGRESRPLFSAPLASCVVLLRQPLHNDTHED